MPMGEMTPMPVMTTRLMIVGDSIRLEFGMIG